MIDFDSSLPPTMNSICGVAPIYRDYLKNPPTTRYEEDSVRAERVKTFMYRYENKLDIWSGLPLPEEITLTPNEIQMNSVLVIRPYKYFDTWVFDDKSVSLHREPFVSGADTMIDRAIETYDIKNASEGFTMLFSSTKFPSSQIELTWLRQQDGGNIYSWKHHNLEGWLCPALLKYFSKPPKKIFIEVRQ